MLPILPADNQLSVTTYGQLTTNANSSTNNPPYARSNGGVLQRRLPQIPSTKTSSDQKLLETDLVKVPQLTFNAERRYILANRRFA